eukprot:CAMPEP_0114171682 /NCGR_PEP_ID=MMETSP0043_2-20121206/34829_1 /TAXON_ID=464988 /ORGANISM="Hemiselmis andersenii, Strain CCMP644" /LENGTH=61 /DNA_ID=CAMNT_0001269421 /DNA_START=443 /DNA_END=624 /DNA_ORIENTATION=+
MAGEILSGCLPLINNDSTNSKGGGWHLGYFMNTARVTWAKIPAQLQAKKNEKWWRRRRHPP